MNQGYGTIAGGAAMLHAAGSYAGEQAARQLEVPAAVQRLEQAVSTATEFLDRLDGRLTGTVARSNPPMPAEASKGQQIRGVIQSGLGSQLDSIAEHVERLGNRAHDLISRLEV